MFGGFDEYMYLIFYFGLVLFGLPTLGIGSVIYIILKKRGKKSAEGFQFHLPFTSSTEDSLSQLMFSMSFFFLALAMLALNKDFGEPVPWEGIILASSLGAVGLGYYFKLAYPLLFGHFGTLVWLGIKYGQWIKQYAIQFGNSYYTSFSETNTLPLVASYLVIFVVYMLLSYSQKMFSKYKNVSEMYFMAGAVPITLAIFLLSTKNMLGNLLELTGDQSLFQIWQILAVFIFILGVGIGLILYNLIKKTASSEYLFVSIFLFVLFALLAFLPAQDYVAFGHMSRMRSIGFGSAAVQEVNVGSYVFQWGLLLFFNILIFAEFVGLILLGYREKDSRKVNIGAIALFILIFIKYFDWFFNFMDKSLFFTLAGLMLFGLGGFMERARRNVVASIKEDSNS